MRKVGTVVRAGRAQRWTRPLFLGIASLSLALVVAAGCTPVKPTPPIDTPDTAAPGAPSTPDLAASSDTGVSNTDNITNDTAPTFTGTAEAGSTVKLLEGGTEIGSGTATGGAYSVTTSALAEGDHTITATATDPANNTSPASSGLVVTIDVTAPAGPSTPVLDALSDSGTPGDAMTNDNTPAFTGTADANTTVTIHDGGTAVGSAPATGGNYSVVTSALPDGDRAITATASDVAGNPSAASAPLAITIDTSAPVVSITTPANGAVTNDSTPALSGAAEGAQVTVSIFAGPAPSGTPVQTLTPPATSGAWSQDAGALTDGVYTVQATQGDTAGNVGTSSANTFTVDTVAPLAPSTPDLDAGSDTGTSATDDTTSDATPTFTGTTEADSMVRILADGTEVGSATATGGTYSITTAALTDDVYDITATATDAANNISDPSGALSVTIDSTVPAAPPTPNLDGGSDTGDSNDDITSDDTPTFTGAAEAGSTVRIFAGLTEVGSGTATGGNYSITTSVLSDAVHSITATATDVAGTSPASGALSVTIDTTGPTVTVVSPAGGAVTSDDTPEVSGTASLDSTVTVEIYAGTDTSGTPVGTLTPTAAGGLWSGPATTLADGDYTVVATQTDAAGNTGTSAANTFTVDTTAPAAPSTPNLDASSDTGTSESDNITNDNTPTFTGTAEEGSLVRILADGTEVGSGTANGGANYSITTSVLADGVHDITATATDAALNTSGPSGELEVTIDNNVPAAPSTPDLVASSDTGAFDTDDVTSDDTPTFTGTAEPGSVIRILDGLTEVGSGTATGGTYSITTSALSDEVHSITATATDVAGTSPPSGALSVTIDTTDPSVAVVVPADGAVTNDDTPSVSGTAQDGVVTVTIYEGTDTAGTVNQTLTPTATGGLWSDTVTTLADGTYTVRATQTDTAGNTGTSSAHTFTVDIAAPPAPSTPDLAAASDTGTSNDDDVTLITTPAFTGTADAGSTVAILADGSEVGSETATGIGTYDVTITTPLAEGVRSITATATNVAGTSTSSAALSVTIDTTAPVAPSTPALDAGSDSGTLSDDVTNDATPTLTGTAEPDASVTINEGLDLLGSDPGGDYSITTAPLSDGVHNLTATASDVAGNPSAPSGALALTIDTTAPAVTLTTPADDSDTTDDTPEIAGGAGTAAGDLPTIEATIYAGTDTLGTVVQTLTPTAVGGSWSTTATTLANGDYAAQASQEDTAGNTGLSSANTFTVALAGISGTVLNGDDSPAVGATVGVLTAGDVLVTATSTNASGNYFVALPDGDYKVGFIASTGCSEFFDNQPTQATADVVTVAGAPVDTDAQFDCATISGQVTDESAAGLGNVAVGAFDTDENLLTFVTTDAGGNYTMQVRDGARKVRFQDLSATYASEWYDDEASFEDADVLNLAAGDSVTADAELASGSGTISGTVTDENANTLPDVQVNVVSPYNELPIESTTTDANGDYSVPVSASEYKIRFSLNGCNTYYDDAPDFASADVVPVAPDADITADAELDCPVITGTVSNAGGGLAGMIVSVFPANLPFPSPVANAVTDASGEYSLLVGDGAYKIAFNTPHLGPCGEYYQDETDFASADAVNVAGSDVTVNGLLECGTISGHVTNLSNRPLANAGVEIVPTAGGATISARTDANGDYAAVVSSGSYNIDFGPFECGEVYDEQSMFGTPDEVIVGPSGDVVINEDLDCGTISGTVTDPDGAPRASARVWIFDPSGTPINAAITDADGEYVIVAADGAYRVNFWSDDSDGACSEWYDDESTFEDADDVSIISGGNATGDAQLNCGTIEGHVTDASDNPRSGIAVQAYDTAGTFVTSTFTNASGDYSFELSPGSYNVRLGGGGFGCTAVEWYDEQPDQSSADPVTVTTGNTTTADAELPGCGTLSGTVTDETNGSGVFAFVQVYNASDTAVASTFTNANGNYTVQLGPGQYRIQFSTFGSHVGEFHLDDPDLASADPATVTVGAVTTIDAALAPA